MMSVFNLTGAAKYSLASIYIFIYLFLHKKKNRKVKTDALTDHANLLLGDLLLKLLVRVCFQQLTMYAVKMGHGIAATNCSVTLKYAGS